MVLSPGARVGGYVVERVVGSGGMGCVYAAKHEFLGVEVALKVLHREFCGRADLVGKTRAEAQLLRQLAHPHLVRVSDAGMESDGTVWTAMDLLEGESLRATLLRQRLPVEKVVRYVMQAADGLCAAHEHGVIHRDIKPENIFITTQSGVKLLDFGTAKFRELARTAIDAERFATASYAPPEQLTGQPVDGRADVYSLGVVMHEALAGAHFLQRPDGTWPTVAELLMLQLSQDPGCEALPTDVAAVVRRATAKDPAERFGTMRDFLDALHGLGIAAAPTVDEPAAEAPGGIRLGTTLALALVVAACSVGLTVLLNDRTTDAVAPASAKDRDPTPGPAAAPAPRPRAPEPTTAPPAAPTNAPPPPPAAPPSPMPVSPPPSPRPAPPPAAPPPPPPAAPPPASTSFQRF